MKTIRLLILAAAAMTAAGCGGKKSDDVKIIAHRGYWNTEGSAQNSISSLKNAMEFGAYGSEFDVLVTADGIPVVHHDDKTRNGIVIERTTYVDLIAQAPKLSNGERIPTLDEYLAAWNGHRTKLILEIKSASTPEKETFFVEKILDVVKKHKVRPQQIEYIAFSWHVCREIKRLDPKATVLYLEGDKTPQEVADAGLDGIDYAVWKLVNRPGWIAEARELGLLVNVWTVNDAPVMRYMIELGVDYITTDEPAMLRGIISGAASGTPDTE